MIYCVNLLESMPDSTTAVRCRSVDIYYILCSAEGSGIDWKELRQEESSEVHQLGCCGNRPWAPESPPHTECFSTTVPVRGSQESQSTT